MFTSAARSIVFDCIGALPQAVFDLNHDQRVKSYQMTSSWLFSVTQLAMIYNGKKRREACEIDQTMEKSDSGYLRVLLRV